MSPRPVRTRRINGIPPLKGYKPFGKGTQRNENPVFLLHEEYEAIRLCDYEMMNHLEASKIMNVSRPTLSRIYSGARRKVAKAFVEAREIIIEGGKIYFDSEWYHCDSCGCYFNNPGGGTPEHCSLCGNSEISHCEDIEK